MTLESINDPDNKLSNHLRFITKTIHEKFFDPTYMVF